MQKGRFSVESRSQATCSARGQRVKVWGSASLAVPVVTTLCCCYVNAAMSDRHVTGWAWLCPSKNLFAKIDRGGFGLWAPVCCFSVGRVWSGVPPSGAGWVSREPSCALWVVSSILLRGAYSSSFPSTLVMTIKNVSKHCRMSSGGDRCC